MAVQKESTTQNGAASMSRPAPATIAARTRRLPPPVERMALIPPGVSLRESVRTRKDSP